MHEHHSKKLNRFWGKMKLLSGFGKWLSLQIEWQNRPLVNASAIFTSFHQIQVIVKFTIMSNKYDDEEGAAFK